MIWDPRHERAGGLSNVAAHVAGAIGDVLDGENHDERNMGEIARAVECFVGQNIPEGVIEAQCLVMLASRALSSLGDNEAARRLILFGTGLVRPQEWEFSGGDTVWVLDLKRMMVRQDEYMELIFFSSLSVILDAVAEVWDGASGRGVLGLRNVCSCAAAITGDIADKKAVGRFAGEILDLCSGRLARIGEEKGWSEVPRVIDLDA